MASIVGDLEKLELLEIEELNNLDQHTVETGIVNSGLQNRPITYEVNDIWEEYLLDIGINAPLKKLTQKSDFKPQEVFEIFQKQIIKIEAQYEMHKINESRLFYLEIDLDTLEICNEATYKGKTLIEGLNLVVNELTKKNIKPIVTINQLPGFRNIDEQNIRKANAQRFVETCLQPSKVKFLKEFTNTSYTEEIQAFLDQKTGILDHSAFRISADMSRMLKGNSTTEDFIWNNDVVNNLADSIKLARVNEVDFSLCIHHFTLPTWLKGGWENPEISNVYAKYAEQLLEKLEELDALPSRVLTLNEPMSDIPAGYIDGSWPPYKKTDPLLIGLPKILPRLNGIWGKFKGVQRFENLMQTSINTHINMYDTIKSKFPELPVGFTFNLPVYSPFSDLPVVTHIDGYIAGMVQKINESWLERLFEITENRGKSTFDYMGLQFYNKYFAGVSGRNVAANPGELDIMPDRMNPMMNGWGYYPEGLFSNIFRITKKFLELSRETGIVPGLDISEIGKPSIYDPHDYYLLLKKSVEDINKVNPIKIKFMHFWTQQDNFEWGAKFNNSRFGTQDLEGNSKPKSNKSLSPINWQDKGIVDSARDLLFHMLMNNHHKSSHFEEWLLKIEKQIEL